GDLAVVVVHAEVAQGDALVVQGMGQQADAAAQVQQRPGGVAQRFAHARLQRVAAQLRPRVVVVVPVAQQGAGQERTGDAFGGVPRQRSRLGSGHRLQRGLLPCSAARAAGSASADHRAYMLADGCRPSSASIAVSPPRSRLTGPMSTQCAPARAVSSRQMALKASIWLATRSRSRPWAKANGVTPQSGMASTSTRAASPPANPAARRSRAAKRVRKPPGSSPRYWSFTPASRLTRAWSVAI